MTADDFVAALLNDVPEVQPIVREHMEDNDELLLHLLTAGLRRYAMQAFDSGDSDALGRLLYVIDRALREGNDPGNNAMAVSFVEDTPWWDEAMQPFIARWPEGLRAEADTQRGGPPRRRPQLGTSSYLSAADIR
jgi:hypothetical protein